MLHDPITRIMGDELGVVIANYSDIVLIIDAKFLNGGGETGRHLIVSSELIQVKNIIFYKALINFTCAPYLS